MTTTATTACATGLPAVRGRDVLLVTGVSVVATLLLAVVAMLVADAVWASDAVLPAGVVGASAGLCAGPAALARRRRWGWRELGFVRSRRSAWHLWWQVPASIVGGASGAALLGPALGLGLVPDAGPGPEQEYVAAALSVSPLLLLLVAVLVVVVVPVAEEVVFRRVLLDWLRQRLPVPVAVVLTAVVFAAAHVLPVAMVYVVFLGLAAGWLRVWHGTLWAPVALHAVNNAFVTALTASVLLS